jgi:hypothetical protein
MTLINNKSSATMAARRCHRRLRMSLKLVVLLEEDSFQASTMH